MNRSSKRKKNRGKNPGQIIITITISNQQMIKRQNLFVNKIKVNSFDRICGVQLNKLLKFNVDCITKAHTQLTLN